MTEQPYYIHGRFGKEPAKMPCNECPLRRDSVPGHLGGYTPQMYIDVLHGDADLACHLSKGFQEGEREQQRSCTGVAMYRANTHCLPLGTNARDAILSVVAEDGDRSNVFASPEEFRAHHTVKDTA